MVLPPNPTRHSKLQNNKSEPLQNTSYLAQLTTHFQQNNRHNIPPNPNGSLRPLLPGHNPCQRSPPNLLPPARPSPPQRLLPRLSAPQRPRLPNLPLRKIPHRLVPGQRNPPRRPLRHAQGLLLPQLRLLQRPFPAGRPLHRHRVPRVHFPEYLA